MKSTKHLILSYSSILFLFLCLSCYGPKATLTSLDVDSIPEKDNTPPTFEWQVTNLQTNAVRTFTDLQDSMIVTSPGEFEIVFIGKDPESGIKTMGLESISNGMICIDIKKEEGVGNSSISQAVPMDLSDLSPAPKEWQVSIILGVGGCGKGQATTATRGIGAIVENYHGGVVHPVFELIGKFEE